MRKKLLTFWYGLDGWVRLLIQVWLAVVVVIILVSAVVVNQFLYDLEALKYAIWLVGLNSVLMFFIAKTSRQLALTLLITCILIVISLILYYVLLGQTLI